MGPEDRDDGNDYQETLNELEQVRAELNDLHIEVEDIRTDKNDLQKQVATLEAEKRELLKVIAAADVLRTSFRARGRPPAFIKSYDTLRKGVSMPEEVTK